MNRVPAPISIFRIMMVSFSPVFAIIHVMDTDNNKVNGDGNQPSFEQESPKPIFESVAVESPPSTDTSAPQMQPEEVSSDVASTEDVMNEAPPMMPPDLPGPMYEESKTKYFIIGGAVLFFIIILFVLLKLVFRGPATASKPVTLTYWGLWEDKDVMDPLIADYKSKNPNVTINYVKMEPQEYREKLIARSKNGTGPDIFRFHNTWLPEIQEVAAPLPESIMSNAEFEKTFYPVHAKDLKVDKYYYGIPLEIDGLVLLYNNSLFKKAGISQAPSNWDQVADVVKQLTLADATGKLLTSGLAIGTSSNIEHFSDIIGLMLIQNNPDKATLDKPISALSTFNSQTGVGALQAYRKMAEPPTAFWDDTMPNSVVAFTQEKVSMIFAPTWQIANIHAQNPDLDIKVAPVPKVPNSISISIANYWVEGVSKVSQNQLEAWKFVKFLSEKDNMVKLYANQTKTRIVGEPYSRVDLADQLAKNQYLNVVIQQAPQYVSLPLISRTNDNGLNDRIIDYLKNAVNATINGVGYQEAANTAQKGIDQILGQYKLQ